MDPKLRTEWDKFLNGEWTYTQPQEEGNYPIAARDGGEAGFRGIYKDPRNGQMKPTSDWRGVWWSVPMPAFPPVHIFPPGPPRTT